MKVNPLYPALLTVFLALQTSVAYAQKHGMTLGERRKPAQQDLKADPKLPLPKLEEPVRGSDETGPAVALKDPTTHWKKSVPDFVKQDVYALKDPAGKSLVFSSYTDKKTGTKYEANARISIMAYPERVLGKDEDGKEVKDSARYIVVEYGENFKKTKKMNMNSRVPVLDLSIGYDAQLFLIKKGITYAEYVPEKGDGKEFYSPWLNADFDNYFTVDKFHKYISKQYCEDYLGNDRFLKGDRITGVVMKKEKGKEVYYIKVSNYQDMQMKTLPDEKITLEFERP